MTTAVFPARRVGALKAAHHGVVLAGRGITKIRRDPTQIMSAMIQPVTTLVMFACTFGGSVAGSIAGYVQQLVPGLMVQNILLATISVGVALNTDVTRGIVDRFRSMPIGAAAPMVGTVLAASARYLIALVVLLLVATAAGFRVHTSVLALLAAVAILVVAGLCMCWIAVFVGMRVKNTASVHAVLSGVLLPLTFVSNIFVPTSSMPGWLQAWADVSPVSLLADTARGLTIEGPVAVPLLGSVAWMVVIVTVFFPLAVRAYRERVQ